MRICQSCSFAFAASGWRCPACDFVPPIIGAIPALAPDLALRNDGFPAAGFEDLIELESANFWFRSRNKLINWALQKWFPEARSLLEIGCGTGFVLSGIEREFPDLALSGSEIHIAGLRHAASRLNRAELFQMDAREIPFADEFDVIGCFDVLEHITEDSDVLSQIFKAIRPGGGILITVPQHPFLWGPDDEYAEHVRRYTSTDLIRKLASAGFRLAHITSFVSLLLPFMIASRSWRKLSGAKYDPTAEFRIAPALNWSFERMLDCERGLIAAGIRFPLGGSLLAVAVKP